MKLVLVSDLHIHDWSEHRIIEGGVPSRLMHGVGVLEDVRVYCNEHDINVIIIAGDLFHKRNVIYTQPYQMVVDKLATMKRDGLTVLALDGNHDHGNKTGTIHTIDTLWSAELLDAAVPVQHGYASWELPDGLTVHAFSYCDNRDLLMERVEKAIANASPASTQIGVFHHGFKGARVGSALEYVVKEDVDANDFAKAFDFIFSGHYHGRQHIGGLANALYLGSPMQMVRGEGKEEKGFTVYDSKTNTCELIPLDRPRFVKLSQASLDLDRAKAAKRISGNYVDYVYQTIEGSHDNMIQALHRLGAAGVKLVPEPRKTKEAKKRLAIDPTLSPKKVLERYVAYRKDDVKGLDQTELLRIGLDFYTRGDD